LHGPSTLTISLPSKWAKASNIKKGDELNVDEEGDFLRVYSGHERLLSKKASFDFSGMTEESVRSLIAVLHKAGYDEVEVTFKNPDTVKVIHDTIDTMLIGYEIVEQKGNVCVVRNVSGDHISELDTLARRAFLVALALSNNSLEEIRKARIDKLEELLVLEKTNNKLTNYCHRLINKKPYKDEKTVFLYVILWVFESICDDYKDLLKFIISQKKFKVRSEILDLLSRVNNLLQSYYSLFYDYSALKMTNIRKEIKALREGLFNMSFATKEKPFFCYLSSIVSRVSDALGSTSGLNC
jgi:phosphate uptake regulator